MNAIKIIEDMIAELVKTQDTHGNIGSNYSEIQDKIEVLEEAISKIKMPKPNIYCPQCEDDTVDYEEINGTHIYICRECSMVMVEWHGEKDTLNLIDRLHKK